MQLKLYFPGSILCFNWRFKQTHTFYASANNPGAAEMARSIAAFARQDSLLVPSDATEREL